MRIYSNQLSDNLRNNFAKVYIISSDEPYWYEYAGSLIIQKAISMGFSTSNKENFSDDSISLDDLREALTSTGLFADNIIVEVSLTNIKSEKAKKVISLITECLHDDLLVILKIPQVTQADLKTKIMQALDKEAVTIIYYPATDQDLINLITEKSQQFNLNLSYEAKNLIKQTYEGNLFALVQSLEKLSLSGFSGNVDLNSISQYIENSNHFSVFSIIDSFIDSKVSADKRLRIIETLKDEGIQMVDMISKLGSAISNLYELKDCLDNNISPDTFFDAHPLLKALKQKRQIYITAAQSISTATLKQMIKLICKADIYARSFDNEMAYLLIRDIVVLRNNPKTILVE